jgi:hypothetical protein
MAVTATAHTAMGTTYKLIQRNRRLLTKLASKMHLAVAFTSAESHNDAKRPPVFAMEKPLRALRASVVKLSLPLAVTQLPCSERIMLLPLDGDPAKIGEFGDHCAPAEAPIAAGLDAAERHLRFISHRRAIDMADAGFQPS